MSENIQAPQGWTPQHAAPQTAPVRPAVVSALVTAAAGLAILVGSLLPWATVISAFGEMNMSGVGGDGTITLVAGVVVLALAIVQALGRTGAIFRWLAAGVAVVAGIVAGLALARISNVEQVEFAASEPGIGLYVVIVGAALGVVGAVTRPQGLAKTARLQ